MQGDTLCIVCKMKRLLKSIYVTVDDRMAGKHAMFVAAQQHLVAGFLEYSCFCVKLKMSLQKNNE